MQILTLLILSLFAHAQEPVTTQRTILVKAGLKNMVMLPYRACVDLLVKKARYKDLLLDKELASFLTIKRNQLLFTTENSFSFKNSTEDFACVIPKDYGFCGGMTEVLRDVSYLAFFDPKNILNETVPTERSEKIKFYMSKFARMKSGEAVAIPGYSNLNELSRDPDIERELKIFVGKVWGEEAVEVSDINVFLDARKKMSSKEIETTKADIAQRIDRKFLPKIFFTAFSARPVGGKRIHVVTVYKYEKDNQGNMKLFTWETNSHPHEVENNLPFIEIKSNGEIFYQPWYDDHVKAKQDPIDPLAGVVARISVPGDDGDGIARYAAEIKRFCAANPQLCRP